MDLLLFTFQGFVFQFADTTTLLIWNTLAGNETLWQKCIGQGAKKSKPTRPLEGRRTCSRKGVRNEGKDLKVLV